MHTQSQLSGEIALPPSSFGRIRRRHPTTATAPRSISGRSADRTDCAPLRDEIEAYALHALAANGFGDAIVGRPEQAYRPTSSRLDQGTRAHRSSQFVQSIEATVWTVRAVARQMVARWKRQGVARATYIALCELDTRTLRDLGFDRSEISSVAAEISGDAYSSRTRVVLAQRGLPR